MKLKLTHYKKNLSSNELSMILNHVKDDVKYRLIFKIMAYIGLRIGEVSRIKRNDIQGDFETLRVELEKSHKIVERVIPESLKEDFMEYLEKYPSKEEYLFLPDGRSDNKYLQVTSIRWKFYKVIKESGLDDTYYHRRDGKPLFRISPHTLRHYFVTQFYNHSSYDLLLTKEVIGHKKLDTTLMYISPRNLEREIINKIF